MRKDKTLLLLIIFSFSISGLVFGEEKATKEAPVDTTSNEKQTPKPEAKSGKIYVWIDKKGNRIYSDTPPKEGAEELVIEKGSEYSPADTQPIGQSPQPKVVPEQPSYTNFAIVSPAQNATIRNNAGNIQLALDIRPKLEDKHQVVIMMDGKEVARSSSTIVSLSNVDRGTHQFTAQIRSMSGEIIRSSTPVTVHLHRAFIRPSS